MAIHYKIPEDATVFDPDEDLTEQEHADSCDINIMMKNVHRGLQVRGTHGEPIFGYDDTTMTGLQHRIDKANLERELAKTADEHEFTDEELAYMPEKVAQQFKFKKKAQKPDANANDKTNAKQSVTEPSKIEKTEPATKTTIE